MLLTSMMQWTKEEQSAERCNGGKSPWLKEIDKAEHGPLPLGLGNFPQGTGSGKSHTHIPG